MAYRYNGENLCEKKMVVDPEKASWFGLIKLLFSSDVKSRDFIECPGEDRLRDFNHRWLIFISVLAQKIFLNLRIPLDRIGNAIETWFNLLHVNGGIFNLFLRFIKGEVIMPERSSGSFRSTAANCDWRIEMDKNIKGGDTKYNSGLAFMASKLSYENEECIKSVVTDHWKMECLDCYNFQNDVDISWYQFNGVGKLHRGFTNALGLQKHGWPNQVDSETTHLYAYYEIRRMLKQILQKNQNAKFIVTGHSLGGALAILFVGVLIIHKEDLLLDKIEGVYTFGQPRVGDREFGSFMEKKMKEYDIRYLRYVYCNDIVPRLPYDDSTLLYKHFGPCLYYNSLYQGKILAEEPNKNYFNLLWVIPKNLNACWELIRSVVIPWLSGKEYRESWFMIVMRIIGLVIPGLSAHLFQDYDNSTRLGSLPQLRHHQD
ncbi:triacylglycerol lipase OBL1-like isoform X2 [Euphorbia lathyris]|uniref:triacylglycerol lipase OBL1-like isoform X2 n=1 Tax=Euphorbia lathyris TaxID=212925 RepID=UPI0033143986